ncbi:MAG TPA: hypothetical protein VMF91_01955 [Bryobacteraceae bacterium]|nr:hypothetical protein [Bryobacteraceae bacterium]
MPKPQPIPDILSYGPFRFPIYDPGPPWWYDSVDEAVQHEFIIEQLTTARQILQVQIAAIDRQVALLSREK